MCGTMRYRFGAIDVTPLGEALTELPEWLCA
jgi:hypothetical protein